jgi:hypothetical protein
MRDTPHRSFTGRTLGSARLDQVGYSKLWSNCARILALHLNQDYPQEIEIILRDIEVYDILDRQ